jgi:EAL and modified HD-GYP domain-containing signal transduction protein
MNAPDLTLDELEGLVASDVQLNVKLLKFIKSAYFGLPTKVDSIRKALLFVGVNTLAAVATLLMMSQFANKPQELVFTAMVRAKMAERLGAHLGHPETDRHFTVGMLSVLDALMDTPMAQLLSELPLSQEIEDALLIPDSDGDLSTVLRVVRAFERGDFDAVSAAFVPLDVASSAYRFALTWACQTQAAIAA